jgi:tripartite-type tricarboxylate transporter receptor subunit TctC
MPINRRDFTHLIGAGLALTVISRDSGAQSYPSRPIRLVVPFPPGGAFDAVGRPLAEKLKPLLGTLTIENIGGGGSSLGAAAVTRAPADGYTLLLGGTQTHVNEALLKARPLYDPLKDLEPIASVAGYFLGIAVHPSLPIRNLAELIAYANSNPGKHSNGHAGVGTIQHLTGELFKSATRTDLVQIPYRGTGPAISDLVAGQVPVGIVGVTGQVLELHGAGKMRLLAVTSPKRLAAGPDVPTASEQGQPRLTVTGTIGLLVPAGAPARIIQQISDATRTALTEPSYRKMLTDSGMEAATDTSPEGLRRALAADIALWSPVVKALELRLE